MIKLVACDMAGTTIDEHGDVYVALARCVEETGAAASPDPDVPGAGRTSGGPLPGAG